MTKEEVIKKVKEQNFPKGEFIVFGAAPFVIYGIRDVRDIDMLVSVELYKKLNAKGWKKVSKGPSDEPLTNDVFEAHDNWDFSQYAPTLEELLTRATEYEGIDFASLDDVRKWKEVSGRPKDITDLKLIDDYLATIPDTNK